MVQGEVYKRPGLHGLCLGKTLKAQVIGKSKTTGTCITFKPDPTIFTITTEFNRHPGPSLPNWPSSIRREYAQRRREENKQEKFLYKGIEEFVRQLGKGKNTLTQSIVLAAQG